MGMKFSIVNAIKQNFPGSKSAWTAADIPDLTGKVVIVTGGNTGIGKETVKQLLLHNARVYLAARSPEKGAKAIADLKAETGKEAIYLKMDLSELASVKASAEEFTSKEKALHILINNGGVMGPPKNQLTKDGYDLQYGTNVLGHFYLVQLLLPTLLSTASSTSSKVRVVTVSSFAHEMGPSFDFEITGKAVADGVPVEKVKKARAKYPSMDLYGISKCGDILFAKELARRYGDKGIVSMANHPGLIATELTRHFVGIAQRINNLWTYPIPLGALTQLRAATDPAGDDWNGKYLVPWGRLWHPRADTEDEAVAKKLWEIMEAETKDL